MRKIIAADLWPVMGPTETFNDAAKFEYAHSQMRLRQLVENILLYDQVVLPTDDLLSLKILGLALGAESLASLMDAGVLRFARFKGVPAYIGNGHGLSVINVVKKGTSGRGMAWQPTGVGARAIFSELPGVSGRRAGQLASTVVSLTQEFELASYLEQLRANTYSAVRSSTIDEALRIKSSDLLSLPGSTPNTITLVDKLRSPIDPNDEIAKLMRVARTEVERLAQGLTSSDDLSTLSPIGKVLAATGEDGSLNMLRQITDVPDFGRATLEGAVTVAEVLKLRESRHWQEFTTWFHDTCKSDPAIVGREYVQLLKAPGQLDTKFFRTVRLLIPVFIGLVSPTGGVVASVADTYLTPLIKGPSAKYFIEELEQLAD